MVWLACNVRQSDWIFSLLLYCRQPVSSFAVPLNAAEVISMEMKFHPCTAVDSDCQVWPSFIVVCRMH